MLISVICMTLVTQGCVSLDNSNNSSSSSSSSAALSQLVIAEPLAINFKSEIAIARLSEVINRVKITDEQKAHHNWRGSNRCRCRHISSRNVRR